MKQTKNYSGAKKDGVQLGFRPTPELRARVEEAAKREEIKLSEVIRRCVQKCLDNANSTTDTGMESATQKATKVAGRKHRNKT